MTEARLELVWPGKDKFLLVPKDTDGKPVWVERDHPAASEVRLADFTDVVGDVPEDPYAANLLFTSLSAALSLQNALPFLPSSGTFRYPDKVSLLLPLKQDNPHK